MPITLRILLLFLIVFADSSLASNSLHFTPERIAEINTVVEKQMASNNVPGASIALIESGKVVHLAAFGHADASGRPVTTQTPFQLASISKSFTALLILQLEREGKLELDDPVKKFVPWFETATPGQADRITIRHLLQHNSGLSTQIGNLTQNSVYRGEDAAELAVKKLLGAKLIAEPGTRFEYSNANYHVATLIVELIEERPFEQAVHKRILQPLGMKNSYVQVPSTDAVREAVGFPHWFGIPIERSFILGRMKMGDGGITASIEDMAVYISAIMNGDPAIMTPSIKKKLLDSSQNTARYALGWETTAFQESTLYEHSGGNGGFMTWTGFTENQPNRNSIGFVILSNSSSAVHDQFITNARRAILGQELGPAGVNTVNLYSLIWLYGLTIVLAFLIYRAVVKYKPRSFGFKQLVFPALCLCVAYTNIVLVPSLNKITVLNIYPFFPDLAVGLILSGTLAVILAVIRMTKLLTMPKSTASPQ